jgi:two-component system cell cycle sensor histidine kinase/response regulator CckA
MNLAQSSTDPEHVEAFVESSEDAIISKTLDGTILTWNAGAERIYGYRATEAIGHRISLVLPDDRAAEETEILERIGRGEHVKHLETTRRTNTGRVITVWLTISPIRDESGRSIGASCVARDITERKELDEKLWHKQRLESLGVLACGIAHDFNSLLTSILGNTTLALETLPIDAPARGLLLNVCSASERASHLTRQLLAYGGTGRSVSEPVNISGLVRDIANLIQTSIPTNVRVRLELVDEVSLLGCPLG